MLQKSTKILAVFLLFWATTANAVDLKYVKFGIGYSFVQGTTVVLEELELHAPDGPQINELSSLPSECFSEPGITSFKGLGKIKPEELDYAFRALSINNNSIEFYCGAKVVSPRIFMEASADKEKWYVFNNPAVEALNFQLFAHLSARFEKVKTMGVEEPNEKGVIKVKKKTGKTEFLFRISDDFVLVAIPAENADDQKALIKALEIKGISTDPFSMSEGDFTAIRLSKIGFEDIAKSVNNAINDGLRMSILQSEISMGRLEGELKRKYGEDWLGVVYDQTFGNKN